MKIGSYEDHTIHDDGSLLRACDDLHDASMDISKIDIDLNTGTFKAEFEQYYLEDTTLVEKERKNFFLEKITYPTLLIKLELTGISNCVINDRSEIGIYSFNKCRINRNILNMIFIEDMEISLTFKVKPQGNSSVLGPTIKKRSMYTLFNYFEIG